MMSKAELKDRLKEAMDNNNMKQTDLVNIGHFDKGQLSAWLSGRYRPKQVNIDKLSRILGVSEAWLMGYDVPRERKNSDEAEHFEAFASEWNETHPHTVKVSDKEFDLIKKYRYLDDHGKDMVDTVINKEYDRCKEEAENTIELTDEEIERLKLEKYLKGSQELLVARKVKK